MNADWATIAALATGLATGFFFVAFIPVLERRQAVARRLGEIVGDPSTQDASLRPVLQALGLPADALLRLFASLPRQGYSGLALFVLVTGGVAWLLTRQWTLALAAVLEGLAFANLWGQNVVAAHTRRLDGQLLPTLLRMSARIRAGATLLQSIEAIARDGPSPTREEFRTVLNEVAVGIPIDQALDRLASRIGTADYQALSIVLAVHRRVGGNLVTVLDNLAATVRERVELRLQVSALTAQQRLSSWVLVCLPVLTLTVFLLADPGYVRPLLATDPGRAVLLTAAFLQVCGSWVIRIAAQVRL
jgi:tight adherence protein B